MRVFRAAAVLGLSTPLVVLACGDGDESSDGTNGGTAAGGKAGSGASGATNGGTGGKAGGASGGSSANGGAGAQGGSAGEGGVSGEAGGQGGDAGSGGDPATGGDPGTGGDSGAAGATGEGGSGGAGAPECGDGVLELGELCFAGPVEEFEGTPYDVAVGTWDGNNTPDILIATGSGVSYMINGGAGVFASAQTLIGFDPSSRIAVGQLDSGGNLDVLASTGGTTRIGFGDGESGTVSTETYVLGEGSVQNLFVGNYLGSGSDDIVIASDQCSEVVVTSGTEGEGYVNVGAAHCAAMRDAVFVHGSAAYNYLAYSSSAGITPVFPDYSATPSLGFSAYSTVVVGGSPSELDTADFDEDGYDDLVTTLLDSGEINVLFSDAEGSYRTVSGSDQFLPLTVDDEAQTQSDVKTGDFDGDGHADIAVSVATLNSVAVFLGDGEGGFSPVTLLPAGTAPGRLAVGDLNADGADDIVVQNSGQVLVILSDP